MAARVFQAGRQDGQPYLNQADILFFDVVVFLVRVEDAVRILFGGAVVAQRQVQNVAVILIIVQNGGDGVVRGMRRCGR